MQIPKHSRKTEVDHMMSFEEYTWRNHIGEPKPLDSNIDPITGKRIRENDSQINPTGLKSNERLLTDEERRILWEQQLEGASRADEQRERERERERQEYPPIEEKPRKYPPRYAIVYAEYLIDHPLEVAKAKIAEWLKEQEELNGEVQETKLEQKEELPVELPAELPVDSSEAEVVFLPADNVVLPDNSDSIAIEIGTLYRKGRESASETLRYHLSVGLRLKAQRESLNRHGAWLPWLEAKEELLGFGVSTANKLMKGASEFVADYEFASVEAALEFVVDYEFGEAEARRLGRQMWGNDRKSSGRAGRQRLVPEKTRDDLSFLPDDQRKVVKAIFKQQFEQLLQDFKQESQEKDRQIQEKDRQIEELKKQVNDSV